MAHGRLYVVENEETMTIVRAISQGKAVQHVTANQFKTRVASADDVAEYMMAGGEIEVSAEVQAMIDSGKGEGDPAPDSEDTPASEAE